MYEHHEIFTQPTNPAVKVWRYMDFTKFVSLLDSRHLFFTRSDKFDDPFEGSWARMNVEARQRWLDAVPEQDKKKLEVTIAGLGKLFQAAVKQVAMNCWHMNEHESAAMWKLYLKSNEGIAIQSSYSNLRDAFIDERSILLGQVRYIDYETDVMNNGDNLLAAFLHKRKSFEHEREVRALVWQPGEGDTITGAGLSVSIDLEKLIERIFIAPNAPSWFADLVRSTVKKFGFSFAVEQSKMADRPIY